ncbi:MAG: DUF4292 domain-containing protein [Bacteroidetes bacterium]|nr:DUF4292 domain-containing protein [Bacteroidota bacterium]
MKKIIFFVVSMTLVASCTTFRKVQVLKEALSKKEANEVQLLSEKSKVDSSAIVKSILDKLAQTKIDFKTMNARLKVDYESANNADNYIVNLSLVKDSAIYITIRGAMGVIGLKALVNKDSLVLIYPLRKNKNIERKSLSYLQEVLKIPITFTTLQDLLIGNPIYMDNAKLVSYKINNNKLEVGLIGNLFKNLVVLNEDHSEILQLKLDDIDISQHRTCAISYSNHVTLNQYQFPLNRELIISAQSRLEVHMEVKEYNFNEPLKYTFGVPKLGKRK